MAVSFVMMHCYNFKEHLKYKKKSSGLDDPAFAKQLAYVIQIYGALGKTKEVIEINKKLVLLAERVPGGNSNLIKVINTLGYSYNSCGLYDEAMAQFQRALEIREKEFGVDTPEVASSYCNIANVYDAKKQYDENIQFLRKAISIREKQGKSMELASIYNNIGLAYQKLNRFEEGTSSIAKSVQVQEELLGPNLGPQHLQLCTVYANLATAYNKANMQNEAIMSLDKGIKLQEKILGEQDPMVVQSRKNLAIYYHSIGRLDEEKEYREKYNIPT